MLTAQDLNGVMAMMPAFATANGADVDATDTVDVDNLRQGVDRAIKDGIDVIATTGSFGEFYDLLWDEFETLTRATVEAVNKRIPVFIGCTALNTREVLRKMQVAQEAGADGVLVGVPFYFPSTVENAVRFYQDIAERFPRLGIMIYHNPTLHNITIPVDAFKKLVEIPNVMAMKDSHRDPATFLRLMQIITGKISVFVSTPQYYSYAPIGCAGCWSFDLWMGTAPLMRLRDAIRSGDDRLARQLTLDLSSGGGPMDLRWRETLTKIAIGYAGYCQAGPLRPPYREIPDDIIEKAKRRAADWNRLCETYRQMPATATV